VLQALERIWSHAKAHGTQALFVFQPSKETVYSPLLGETLFDPTGPLIAALEREGIPCLDLTPVFRQRAAAGEALFFDTDTHPNASASGQALIAQAVLSYLEARAQQYGLEIVKRDPLMSEQ
jgi:hypothetical protein